MSKKRRRSTSPDFVVDGAKTLQPEKKKLKLDYPGRHRCRLLRLLRKRKQIIDLIQSIILQPGQMQLAPVPKFPASPAMAGSSKQGRSSEKAFVPVAESFPPSLNRCHSTSRNNETKMLQKKLKLTTSHKQHIRRRQQLLRWLQTKKQTIAVRGENLEIARYHPLNSISSWFEQILVCSCG